MSMIKILLTARMSSMRLLLSSDQRTVYEASFCSLIKLLLGQVTLVL